MPRLRFKKSPKPDAARVQDEMSDLVDRFGPAVTAKRIPGAVIGTAETKIAHGLGYVPADWWIGRRTTAGVVYESKASDATFLYLRASLATVCTVWVA